MKAVAVIPAYNEASRVALAVADAASQVFAVVVVDDCSRDETAQRAHAAGAHVLRHLINRGQGAALQTGTDYALRVLGADAIIHFDADGQMRGDEIPMMLQPIMSGEADVVLGSRFLGSEAENMPSSRRILLQAGRLFTLLMSGLRVTDTHNGFRVLSRSAALSIRLTLDRMAHASEILDLIKIKNLRYVERPVHIRYSDETLQKGQSIWGAVRILKDLMKKKMTG